MKASNIEPKKFYPRYLLAKMFCDIGQTKKLEDIANEIFNKETKVPSIAIDEMKTELKILLQK